MLFTDQSIAPMVSYTTMILHEPTAKHCAKDPDEVAAMMAAPVTSAALGSQETFSSHVQLVVELYRRR